ncbi:hypothetical protein PUN4_310041 [Paraburkholderia unamae]|nr:hypothetical protein PUN4_310041 [Paraburkholderia unamae]
MDWFLKVRWLDAATRQELQRSPQLVYVPPRLIAFDDRIAVSRDISILARYEIRPKWYWTLRAHGVYKATTGD